MREKITQAEGAGGELGGGRMSRTGLQEDAGSGPWNTGFPCLSLSATTSQHQMPISAGDGGMGLVRSVQLWGPVGHHGFGSSESSSAFGWAFLWMRRGETYLKDIHLGVLVRKIHRSQVKMRLREVHSDYEERCPDLLDGGLTPEGLPLEVTCQETDIGSVEGLVYQLLV